MWLFKLEDLRSKKRSKKIPKVNSQTERSVEKTDFYITWKIF